jgi:branched-chain amino acid transport system ATP-binding protein
MIRLDNIDVFYGKSQALHGISLVVKTGEIVALIGANGAGKTTVLNAVSGLIPCTKGEIFFQDKSIKGLAPEEIAKKGIAHVPERGGIFGKMTVLENLELGTVAQKSGGNLKDRYEKVFRLFPILKERKSQLGGQLSGGERQMLAMGRAIMSDPQLYLLDEPTLGLSPLMVGEIAQTIKEISGQGGTILLVEQNALMALELASRGYVLEIGRISHEGPSGSLMEDEQVKKAYLGL